MTDRQYKTDAFRRWLLSFIRDWTAQFDYPPSARKIAEIARMSHTTIRHHLVALQNQGRLIHEWGNRTWVVVETE